jgi:hypothetical protein
MKKIVDILVIVMFLMSSINITATEVSAADSQGSCAVDSDCSGTDCGIAQCQNIIDGFGTCGLVPMQAGTFCGSAPQACEVQAVCDGVLTACPEKALQPDTFICNSAAGACEKPSFCTGSSGECPAKAFEPNTTVCRPAAGTCDLPDLCTGRNASCPVDAFKPLGEVCSLGLFCSVNDACDGLGQCVGTSRNCSDSISCTVDSCDEVSDACIYSPDSSLCSDGLYCNGAEVCDAALGCQNAIAVDCSYLNKPVIASCSSIPDGNSFTYDSAQAVFATCDDNVDQCTVAEQIFSHACDSLQCGAECDSGNACSDKCIGSVFASSGSCSAGCICEFASQIDCSGLSGWFDTTNLTWIKDTACTEKQQKMQEWRDYSCSVQGCVFNITNTQWVDTNNTRDITDSTPCDDGLFCTVGDICSAGLCVGSEMDCTAEDKSVSTCSYVPDNLPVTFDSYSFTSACDEDADICTAAPADWQAQITHACDTLKCGAECDASTLCPSHCEGAVYYAGTCDSSCECNFAQQNCDSLDNWYNSADPVWVSSGDCTEKELQPKEYRDYSCADASGCTYTITNTSQVDTGNTRNKENGVSCEDSLFCTVGDACQEGQCMRNPRDCTANDILVAECNYNPDNIPGTADLFMFTSACDEDLDVCTQAPGNWQDSILHVCDMVDCGAECELSEDCAPKCIGDSYYFSGSCGSECSCSYQTKNCNLDGWYDTANTRWESSGECTEKEQKEQERRDYRCEVTGCAYNVTSTRWVDLGGARNKENGLSCEDGQFCTTGDSCLEGICQVGSVQKDCSANSVNVAECDYIPDSIAATFDSFSFTSACDEESDQCTMPPADWQSQITHTCDKLVCGAECVNDIECVQTKCVGDSYYTSGACSNQCSCSYNIQNCNDMDGWYATGETQWVPDGQCAEKEQLKKDFRDFTCSVDLGCAYNVTDSQFFDTNVTRNRVDGLACDDGSLCTTGDSCSQGLCAGTPKVCTDDVACTADSCDQETGECVFTPDNAVCDNGLYCDGAEACDVVAGCVPGAAIDCSMNNLPAINTCNNVPDNNPLTLDLADAFVSSCVEDTDSCATVGPVVASSCSISSCGAECESDVNCGQKCAGDTFYFTGSCNEFCTCSY